MVILGCFKRMPHLISVTDQVILRLCKDVTGHLEIFPISLRSPQHAVRPMILALANHCRPPDATSCPMIYNLRSST